MQCQRNDRWQLMWQRKQSDCWWRYRIRICCVILLDLGIGRMIAVLILVDMDKLWSQNVRYCLHSLENRVQVQAVVLLTTVRSTTYKL